MTSPKRVYGDVRKIESTHEFWEERGRQAEALGPLNVTMLQDGDEALAQARDAHEKAVLLDELAPTRGNNVLDVGCGTARWAHDLVGNVRNYFGADFSASLIANGERDLRERFPRGGWTLQVLSATEMTPDRVAAEVPFDRTIVSGVFLYLNDDDVVRCIQQIANLSSTHARLVVKDTVGLEDRLTLDRFYSDKLADDYSAVYRTEDWYTETFVNELGLHGFELTTSTKLFPDALNNRTETAQHYWVMVR